MSINAFSARPVGKSVGAAAISLVITLTVFVIIFVAFLVAPLILLAIAFLAFLVMRPRPTRTEAAQPGSTTATAGGFGAGAR